MTDRLAGRVAIITGGDSGIGQATAVAFGEEGADVMVTHFGDPDGAEETCRRVGETGRRAVAVRLDQRDPDEVEALFGETEHRLGRPDILVNNAGIDAAGKQVAAMTVAEWDDRIRTNLHGPFYCCRAFIRARRAAGGGGRIVNVSSVHQEIPRVGSAAYDASKAGLGGLTRTLCLELAPDRINVNAIAPGMILTPMNQAAIEDAGQHERQVANIPWKRAGEPREVARLAVYLASDDADYISGQTFTIDGGLAMNVGQGA